MGKFLGNDCEMLQVFKVQPMYNPFLLHSKLVSHLYFFQKSSKHHLLIREVSKSEKLVLNKNYFLSELKKIFCHFFTLVKERNVDSAHCEI